MSLIAELPKPYIYIIESFLLFWVFVCFVVVLFCFLLSGTGD